MAVEKAPTVGVWSKMLRSLGVTTTDLKPAEPHVDKQDGKQADKLDVRDDGALGQVPNAAVPAASIGAQGGVKPWQTRTLDLGLDANKKLVAQSVLAVMSGIPVDVLAPELRAHVEGLVGDAKVGDVATMKQVYARCASLLGPEVVAASLGALALAVNDAAHAATDVVGHKDEVPAGKDDRRDWHRTWGLRLLPDDDKAFRDPSYLVALNQESKGIRATTFEGRTSVTQAREKVESEWQKLAPNTRILAYAENGSDAVSLCFQVATFCGRRLKGQEKSNPDMLYFEGVYGGGRGLASSMNFAGWGRSSAASKEGTKLTSPTSTKWGDASVEVLAKEREALARVRDMATKKNPPIGAIFIEPVQGANGVKFYRTEFMLELRKLADELGLPIVADEVLTCGGRTGKFFAYEHYEGFQPDFVVFGKGVQIAGIAEVHREGRQFSQVAKEHDLGLTTAGGDAVRMLKGAQVLKRIHEDGLMENAAAVGKQLVKELRAVQEHHGLEPDASGLGMLVGMTHLNGTKSEISHSWANKRDRYMPPLTLSLDDVKAVAADLKKELPDDHLPELRAKLVDFEQERIDALTKPPSAERDQLLKAIDVDIQRMRGEIAKRSQ